jgi:hypothetical protein
MSETTNGPGTQAGNLCCFRGVALCAVLVPQKIESFADHSDQKMGRHPIAVALILWSPVHAASRMS